MTSSEIVENSISMGLKHLGVRVETRVSTICNLLGEQFDSTGGIAENDGLIDL